MLNSRAVHQGQPRIKHDVCLALVDALELLSAADWNILISLLNLGLGDSKVSTSLARGKSMQTYECRYREGRRLKAASDFD